MLMLMITCNACDNYSDNNGKNIENDQNNVCIDNINNDDFDDDNINSSISYANDGIETIMIYNDNIDTYDFLIIATITTITA